ncbi:hypothetical protein PHPALM_29574 [Phytophthora palmivora]|uniref:PiggyBac transposable element-derived protein domain-containing protein n=1 Tax=Phytophthora palmivora TaxID=4796 RepID=A0A2P4X7A4_9STRA|nr:hypothetical protein PHPALM_29574 [Phytophthora palmivora]
MTKKEEADIVRRDKAAKKARAVQHVEATTALRAAANEKERDRILQEEEDGPVSFYWRTSRISPVGTFSIVPVGAFDIAPAGDFCNAPIGDIASACPPVERALEPAGTVVPTAVSARDDDALNSDIDGDDGDSDGWYSESELAEEGIDRVGSCDVDVSSTCETGDAAYEAVNSSDDGIDGMVLFAREKSRTKRQLERERLEAAKVKLNRDWNLMTANWDKLTKDEMEVLAQDADALKKMRVDGWNFDASSIPMQNKSHPGLFQGEYGPTEAVSEKAESPIQLFFFFLPPRLWLRIASVSNKYYHQHLNERVDRIYSKKKAQDPDATREDVMLQETKRHKKIKPEEILHCIGLLVARMLCPHKHRFVDHWANSAKGAVPKGTFGRFMSKARFSRVMQNLHFTDNTDARAETDRAWKVHSVIDTLQTTFRDGYNVPPVLAFDEAMIPSRSRHNVTRQFMKDKPHKWGPSYS